MKVRNVLIFILFLLIILFLIYYFFFFNKQEGGGAVEVPDGVTGIDTLFVPDTPTPRTPFTGDTSIIETPYVPSDNVFLGDDYDPSLVNPSRSGDGEEITVEETPRLIRLFEGPTAGYRIDKISNDVFDVRVVARGRGDRYLVKTFPYSINLVNSGEFTKVKEGYIFSDYKTLLLYEGENNDFVIKSAFVEFAPTDLNNSIQIFEEDIRVATNDENLIFFTKEIAGETLGFVVNVINPDETKVVWESHFSNWLPRWGRNDKITISTPISEIIKGHVYLIDPEGDEPDVKIFNTGGGGSAFVDTSSGFFVLYETSRESFVGKTTITEQSRETNIQIPVTLPEKCDGFNAVFVCAIPDRIPSETLSGYETVFPDSWYQGDLVFDDSIVQINAVTGERELLLSSDSIDIIRFSGGETFDVVDLKISNDGEYVFFVNKTDRSLWMLRL